MPLRKPVFTVNTLQQQLKDEILRRIRLREWGPGSQLPSEISLAEEFGVSVGTVRKVLSDLEHNHVVERRKGRGTYVRVGDREALSFRFFPLRNELMRVPAARKATMSKRPATEQERARLDLGVSEPIVHIHRICALDDTPALIESISLPAAFVPDLEKLESIPTFMMLHYYDTYGVIVQSADEYISAAVAEDETALSLGVPLGTPLLVLDRVAIDSAGRKFEWRVRTCAPVAGRYFVHVS